LNAGEFDLEQWSPSIQAASQKKKRICTRIGACAALSRMASASSFNDPLPIIKLNVQTLAVMPVRRLQIVSVEMPLRVRRNP
jgi:hypothetical protein